MSARTRRQKASLAAEESEDSLGNGSVSTPSKRASSKKRARSAARGESKEEKENIFLFIPNLIGRMPR
jgi:CDP-diacylglycerol--inositol 3-phosphatidyltransferase